MDIFPILYPEFSVFLEIICATSTALPILIPRALMLTDGKLANWINVEVTYAIIGFLPMNTVSRCSVDMRVKYYEDNLNQDRKTGYFTKVNANQRSRDNLGDNISI